MTRIKLVVPIGVVLGFDTTRKFEFFEEVFPGGWLCDDVVHLVAVNIGEAESAALEFVAELGMVDAHLVKDSGLEIVNVDGILVVVVFVGVDRRAVGADDFGTVFVSMTDGDTTLDAAAGHPH